jgi:ribonuclease P protein component
MDRRFTKAERLTRKADIDACYRTGRRVNGRFMRLHARATDLAVARLAISVPGRLCDAVRRNRWKRMVREAFRLNKETIGVGLDLIVVPTRPPGDLQRPEVEAALLDIVRRIRGSMKG